MRKLISLFSVAAGALSSVSANATILIFSIPGAVQPDENVLF